MHCPNCGVKAAENQRFCRACGFSLERVAQVVEEELSLMHQGDSAPVDENVLRKEQRTDKLTFYVVVIGSVLVLAIAFPAAIYKLFSEGNILPAILLSVIFITLSSASLLFIIRMMIRQHMNGSQPRRIINSVETARDTDKILGPAREPVSSVAEKTTDLLKEKAGSEIDTGKIA